MTGGDRFEELPLLHRRRYGEIGGRAVEIESDHAELGFGHARELIDGGAAGGEVRHHLRGHLCRVGRHALRRHAVIAGEDEDLDRLEARRASALPAREPSDRLLETPQASRRLGEAPLARRDAGGRIVIARGQIEAGRAKIGE